MDTSYKNTSSADPSPRTRVDASSSIAPRSDLTGAVRERKKDKTQTHMGRKLGWAGLGCSIEKPQHTGRSVCLLYIVEHRGCVLNYKQEATPYGLLLDQEVWFGSSTREWSLLPLECVHTSRGAIMLKVSRDQTREIGLQGLDLVEAVSVGEWSLGWRHPWRESYGARFLYTPLTYTHGPEESFADPLSQCRQLTFTWGFLCFPHTGMMRWNTKEDPEHHERK